MKLLNEGFTTIKCNDWEENSQWVIDSLKLNFFYFRFLSPIIHFNSNNRIY